MNPELSSFAARLRAAIAAGFHNQDFDALAVELFYLQFSNCPSYRRVCQRQQIEPASVSVLRQTTPTSARWKQIPCVPTAAFKTLDVSCIPVGERTASFHSSGTTGQIPGRHFHNAKSLAIYEASLWRWFRPHIMGDLKPETWDSRLVLLTPSPGQAPHSSLVHMFETVRQMLGGADAAGRPPFFGAIGKDGSWTLDFDALLAELSPPAPRPVPSAFTLLGTAFSFVHLLDYLLETNRRIQLPDGSRVMETGGYKNRSRTMPKNELHKLITERLGVRPENIICEYGMSELSSQAYDNGIRDFGREASGESASRLAPTAQRRFQFPPWARVQIISPETGREVGEGETGLIRVFDLANAFSVAAIQTEDLGIRRGDSFELAGRAPSAEPRGCSLNNPESLGN